MQRNVYLQGELAEKFGSKFIVNTNRDSGGERWRTRVPASY